MKNLFKKRKPDKVLKIVCFVLIAIILIEGIFFLFLKIKRSNKTIYKTTVTKIIPIDDGYVTVGNSDFRHSKKEKYTSDTKAFIIKYDLNNKIVFEKKYEDGILSKFNDVIRTNDGFLAVGEIQVTEKQIKDGSEEAMLVKYDKDGKELWHKNFVILGANKFLRVVSDNDNYIVVGSSLYEFNLIGNHKTGGAIIVKYDQNGNKLSHANIDGPKTGVYNDILVVDDGYIVVGQIKNNSGIIAKYDKNLQLKWRKLFGTTDNYGFRRIVRFDNSLLVIGSKLSMTNSEEQNGVILKYNYNGDKIGEKTFKIDKVNRIEEILVDNDKIIISGMASKANKDENVNSFVLTLDKNLEIIDKKIKEEDKSIIIGGLVKINNKNYAYGYTNSKIKNIKSNGKDIVSFMIELDNFKYLTLFN